MSNDPPFIDRDTSELDTTQIRTEAIPIAALVTLFAGLALIPFLFVVVFAGSSGLGALLTLLSQFILAVGTGIILLYVVARGIQLAEPEA